MYIKSVTDTIFTRLYEQPQNIMDKNTLFQRPSSQYSSMYLENNSTLLPANTMVSKALNSQIRAAKGAATNISDALAANSNIQKYLSDALSDLEEIYSLANSSANANTSQNARNDLNRTLQSNLENFGKIYETAQFKGEYTMQGGLRTFSAGTGGETTSINYGNANPAYLGIQNLDISSAEGAQAAIDSVSSAMDSIKAQQSLASDDAAMLQDRIDAGSSSLNSSANLMNEDYARKLNQIALENSMAALSNRINYSLNIQAYNVSKSGTNTIFSSLTQMSETINAQQAESLKNQQEKQETDKNTSTSQAAPVAQANTVNSNTQNKQAKQATEKFSNLQDGLKNSAHQTDAPSSNSELKTSQKLTAPESATPSSAPPSSAPNQNKASTTGK